MTCHEFPKTRTAPCTEWLAADCVRPTQFVRRARRQNPVAEVPNVPVGYHQHACKRHSYKSNHCRRYQHRVSPLFACFVTHQRFYTQSSRRSRLDMCNLRSGCLQRRRHRCLRSDYPGAHPLGARNKQGRCHPEDFVKGRNLRIPPVVSLNQYVCCSAIAALSGLRATKPTAPFPLDLIWDTPKPTMKACVV